MPTLADALRQTGYVQDDQPVPQPSTGMAEMLRQHMASLPEQLSTNQAALDSAIGSWNKTDFATGQPNPNYRPEAIQELTQLMPSMVGMIAYHGTPHTIQGKFDLNKVGTGEGAQHFGHGIYFAESPAISAEYKGSDAVKLFANGVETESPVAKQIARYGSPQEYIKSMEKVVAKKTKTLENASKEEILPGLSDYDMAKMDLDGLLKKIDEAKTYKTVENRPVGNLYEVDIPDADIPHYMNWYEKLKDQTPDVKKALGITEDEFENFRVPQSGTNYGFSPQMSGGDFYSELASIVKSKKEASKILSEMGIKGNKYENFQIKQGAGGGTHNYVSFEPSTVEILKQNGKPLTRKELIEEQVNKLKD